MSEHFEDVFDELYRRFERLFRRIERTVKRFEEEMMEDLDQESLCPLTSVYISGDRVIVTADLPLVDPSSIKVELLDPHTLYVEARIKQDIPSEYVSSTLPPCRFKYFKTRISLPLPVSRIESIKLYREILEVRLLA